MTSPVSSSPEPQLPEHWLSVIMPTHHAERWIDEALGSLADQWEPGIECLVLDSSTNDATLRIVEQFAGRIDLRILRRPDLDSWMSKTNAGVALARAPHFCMLHRDDIWLPGRVARVRQWIARAPLAALQFHPSVIIGETGRRLGVWRGPLPGDGRPLPRALLIERLIVQNFIAVPSPVIRCDAYLAVGGVDETLWYTGDWDLYLKLARHGACHYHDEVLAGFRVHGLSQTVQGSRNGGDLRRQMERVLEAHASAVPADRHAAVLARARAAIEVNTRLAEASNGHWRAIAPAAAAILGLGPSGMFEFLRDTRLIERVWPRVRARLSAGG